LRRLEAQHPNARCELYYETPYQLLISVVLSAQTTDKMVNRCMEPVYQAGFDAKTALQWGEQKLLERIRSIGLAPTKARNIVRLSQILVDHFGGSIPTTREDLEDLPGVGRKTANVILGEIFRQPTLAVDTHVYRVSTRLGLQSEKTPEKAELALLKLLPATSLPMAHHWLILHGRYVCKAQKPLCEQCSLNDICPEFLKSANAKLPERGQQRKKRKPNDRRVVATTRIKQMHPN
jgi:endonuclease-3